MRNLVYIFKTLYSKTKIMSYENRKCLIPLEIDIEYYVYTMLI